MVAFVNKFCYWVATEPKQLVVHIIVDFVTEGKRVLVHWIFKTGEVWRVMFVMPVLCGGS